MPHRDRCWEAITFKNKEINTCLQEEQKDLFIYLFIFTAWAEREEGRKNKEVEEIVLYYNRRSLPEGQLRVNPIGLRLAALWE